MTIKVYLKDKIFSILIFAAVEILSVLFLWLIDVRKIFIIYFIFIFVLGYIVVMLQDYIKRKNYYNDILKILAHLDEKTLLSEIIKKAPFLEAQILYDILKESDKFMNDRIAVYERNSREYREYVEMWVHEIKTPVTSAKLMIENNKNIITLRIDEELQKIDAFVEQALYYARSTSLEKDFKVEQVSLKELVTTSIKNYSKTIIQAGGRVELNSLEHIVYTDKKWTLFIIGQIIANAAKYQNGELLIYFNGSSYESGKYLEISDNGIGIPEKDLSRVFDKGFTGENGRRYHKSTGIGLYLCKKLCRKMNMEITISSSNKGTAVRIYFSKNNLLM